MNSRERLIATTQELLWRDGYSATSPSTIQRHAAVGPGSMYHHFAGKSDLALAAIERSAEEMRRRATGSFESPGSALDRIEAYVLQERAVLRGCPIGRLVQDPGVVHDPNLLGVIRDTFVWILSELETLLTEAKAAGEIATQAPPEALAAMLVAVIQGAYTLAISLQSDQPYVQALDGALCLIRGFRQTVPS